MVIKFQCPLTCYWIFLTIIMLVWFLFSCTRWTQKSLDSTKPSGLGSNCLWHGNDNLDPQKKLVQGTGVHNWVPIHMNRGLSTRSTLSQKKTNSKVRKSKTERKLSRTQPKFKCQQNRETWLDFALWPTKKMEAKNKETH
jgi:hypothetical protein